MTIPHFRKKDSPPLCNNNHDSTALSSTTTPPSPNNYNSHDSIAPLSTTVPLPSSCDDGLFGVVPANSDQEPKESQPPETPQTQPDVPHQTEETMEEEPVLFVPSMGAWTKPLVLKFPPPCTPPEPSTPCSYDPQLVQSQIEKFWPSLEKSINLTKKKSSLKVPSLPNLPVTKFPPPKLKENGSLRFPWAARMNPATRNLYRASRPTFRLDGTPEIIIPTKNCVTPKVPRESIKANNIISELPNLAVDQILGQELGPQQTVLTPQHVPFQFGKPGASSTHINSSPATTDSVSPRVALPHKDNSATYKSLPDAKVTYSSTLAGTSSAHTSFQVMDDAPSEITMNEGTALSENDPLKMTPLSTESIQEGF
ncbi:hypothetical protein HID58_072581 [Brassica napus]|uniref:Uncharacterized protein n=1 Tax=Brassica napus TaxID=3708 RepID=A0ABQ7Z4T6_BRANA|nr:hypothetical protein HID58_072581 [Brassica napus]